MNDIKLIHGDCIEEIRKMPDKSIDLTLTSPPYDNLRDYKGYSFNFECIAKELFRVSKQGGVCVWVVGDATISGSETGTSFKQALYFKSVGFNLHDTMIYKKVNPIPLTHNRYEQYFEYMFVFSKGRPKTFNPLLEKCITSGSYTHRRNTGRVVEAATRNRDEITETKPTKQRSNVWEYVIGSRRGETGNHPAPYPEQLASDHIASWTNEGDTVLDPFMGSGTTIKMAKILKRNAIGIEIAPEYYELSKKRISNTQGSML